MRRRGLKKPEDLPLWVADLKLVKLNKNGFEIGNARKGKRQPYWPPGLPVYSFKLRCASGRTITDTEYIRARNPRDAYRRIRVYWPTVEGIRDV